MFDIVPSEIFKLELKIRFDFSFLFLLRTRMGFNVALNATEICFKVLRNEYDPTELKGNGGIESFDE